MDTTETNETISLHGLGFIQVKLTNNQRLHIWHPDLPRRFCYEDSNIHDHRFGFISEVMLGTQRNQYHRVVPSSSECTHSGYLHEGKRTSFGNRPWMHDFDAHIAPVGELTEIPAGRSYFVSPYIYHSTPNEGIVITKMTKTVEHNTQGAHSLCKLGVRPDVDFDRNQLSQKEMWDIVLECVSGIKLEEIIHG